MMSRLISLAIKFATHRSTAGMTSLVLLLVLDSCGYVKHLWQSRRARFYLATKSFASPKHTGSANEQMCVVSTFHHANVKDRCGFWQDQ